MSKLISFLLLVTILTSCSNGKIEYKGVGCASPLRMSFDSVYVDTAYRTEEENERYRQYELLKEKRDIETNRIYDSILKLSKQVYLINKSYSQIIQFTIRTNTQSNPQISKTAIYKLNPGEEKIIGCTWDLSPQRYYENYIYDIVGEREISK